MIFTQQIPVGSKPFFKELEGFSSKDNDYIMIAEDAFYGKTCFRVKIKDDDLFIYKNLTKEEFIQDALQTNVPMKAGKFLAPEFVKYIKLTINDLRRLEPLFNNMDDKHSYEKIIYDAYIENNDFSLTKEQLNNAYEEYKRKRSNV